MINEERLYKALGERIRALREQHDDGSGRMTQASLAQRVGLERTSITNIERGAQKVPLHVLFRICEVLRAPVADVLPSVAEVQVASAETPMAMVEFGGEMYQTTPLVKQALASLLNLGGGHGTQR